MSLFEPSTEVIRKGRAGKPNEFGKMVKLQETENQIVTDYLVYARQPNDSDLLIAAIETHQAKLGRAPYLVALTLVAVWASMMTFGFTIARSAALWSMCSI
jgi:IS5 family transposase